MGTRAGDMDVGVVEFIANKYDMTHFRGREPAEQGIRHAGPVRRVLRLPDLEQAAEKKITGPPWPWRFEYRVRKMIRVCRRHGRRGRGGIHRRRGRKTHLRPGPTSSTVWSSWHHLRPGEEQLPGQGADHLPGRRACHRHGDPHQRGVDDRPDTMELVLDQE